MCAKGDPRKPGSPQPLPRCLQRAGKIAEIWRVSGQFANYCLFDVESPEELHECVSGLPMFGFITTQVEALSTHPNKI